LLSISYPHLEVAERDLRVDLVCQHFWRCGLY